MSYKIAINKMALAGKLENGDNRWDEFTKSFVNRELDTLEIANAIYCGHAYAPWFSGRRKDENWLCAQHIAVDMDTDDARSSILALMGNEFVQVYGGLIHTTPSHTVAKPRARVVFLLDRPILDSAAYEVAIRFVYSLFPGSDPSCIDSSRFLYGSLNCDLELLDNTLPLAHLRSYYNRWRKVEQRPTEAKRQGASYTPQTATTGETTKPGILTPNVFLDYAINDAAGQGRNNRGYRLARQLLAMGLSKFETEGYLRRYQQAVATMKQGDTYTEAEAQASLKSAYSRGMVH